LPAILRADLASVARSIDVLQRAHPLRGVKSGASAASSLGAGCVVAGEVPAAPRLPTGATAAIMSPLVAVRAHLQPGHGRALAL
jgi:hypothetical protein